MYRLLPPVDSAIDGEEEGGGRTQEGGKRVKSSERWEVEGKRRRRRSEKLGGGCQSGFFCACACLCSLQRKGELGKRGEKARGDQLVCKP